MRVMVYYLLMINDSYIHRKLESNLSEIDRLEKDIRKQAFSNIFLIKEMGMRCYSLNEKVRICKAKAGDCTIPFLLSEELIKMLRPVFDKYYSLRYAQFIDAAEMAKC